MAMSLRVLQWGTGNIGTPALRLILQHPELTLAGVKVYSAAKDGVDAGQLCGLAYRVGITASVDADRLVDQGIDCVSYMVADPELSDRA
jgi:4-hydroxy-tetrahydrodipicolinate reductase